MLELYYYPTSHWSRIITLTLEELGLEFERHLIDITRNQSFDPAYLEINPRGVVPTIVDDGQVVWDGRRIARHLDDKAGGNLWRADDAETQSWIKRLHDFPVMLFSYSLWVLGERGEKSADILADKVARARDHAERYPALRELYERKAEFFEAFSKEVYDDAHVAEQERRYRAVLDEMGRVVAERGFLAGPDYTFADAEATSVLFRLKDLGKLDHWVSDASHGLNAYFDRLRARPSFRAVFHDDPLIPDKYMPEE